MGGVLSQDLTTVTVFMMEWKFEFWKMDYLDSVECVVVSFGVLLIEKCMLF